MNKMILIMVFDKNLEYLLFCKRAKNPYKGKLNFVRGKVRYDEHSKIGAYRELEEETGIRRGDIDLHRMMELKFTAFPEHDSKLIVYAGILDKPAITTNLKEELNPLEWLPVTGVNFWDTNLFAGDGNIGYFIVEALRVIGVLDSEFILDGNIIRRPNYTKEAHDGE